MKTNKVSFPHPVLGISDDVEGDFSFTKPIQVQLTREEVLLTADIQLTSASLERLLDEEAVAFCLEIHNPKTLFKRSVFFFKKNKEISLPSSKLRGKVEVGLYIVAMRDIKNYALNEFNPDYSNYNFNIAKGEVLGFGGSCRFIAEKSWIDFMSVSSFMEIQKGDYKEGPVKYNLEGDKVIVELSETDYDKYRQVYFDDPLANIFHTAIAYPALIYTLSYIISSKEEYFKEQDWYLYLEQRGANEENLRDITQWEIDEVADIAQQLLENPLTRTLSGMRDVYDEMTTA